MTSVKHSHLDGIVPRRTRHGGVKAVLGISLSAQAKHGIGKVPEYGAAPSCIWRSVPSAAKAQPITIWSRPTPYIAGDFSSTRKKSAPSTPEPPSRDLTPITCRHSVHLTYAMFVH